MHTSTAAVFASLALFASSVGAAAIPNSEVEVASDSVATSQFVERGSSTFDGTANVRNNEQSCVTTDWFDLLNDTCKSGAVYNVQVGVGYANGKGCESINKRINDRLAGVVKSDDGYNIWGFYCAQAINDQTLIKFSTCLNHANEINGILHEIYPTVNGFNCPNK